MFHIRIITTCLLTTLLCSCGGGGAPPAASSSSASPAMCSGVSVTPPVASTPGGSVLPVLTVPLSGGLPPGSTIRVLWIGNSLTNTALDYNDYGIGPMPARLVPMLAELGITMTYTASIKGGAAFSDHEIYAPTTTAINDGSTYDIVNLQGNPYDAGYASAANFQAAVNTLYTAAHNLGKQVLFQQLWPHLVPDGGSYVTFPNSATALETAAQNMPGAHVVQVQRVWEAIRTTNPTLYAKLYADNIHQSKVGEYLNALTFARFFSGRSVQALTSIPPLVDAALTVSEKQALKNAVDTAVTISFSVSGSSTPYATISVASPTQRQVFAMGSTVSFAATAEDTALGTLSSSIEWRDVSNTLLYTGASFTRVFAPGVYNVTARVVGSTTVSSARQFIVDDGVNDPPVATDRPVSALTCEPFIQVNLTSHATDPDGTINWATLQLDTTGFKGSSAVVSSADASTVNLSYANGYVGADTVRWRVRDSGGLWSNWARMNVTVASH